MMKAPLSLAALVLSTAVAVALGQSGFSSGRFVPPKPIRVILTTGTTWTVPSNWNNASNSEEAIGGGGEGTFSTTHVGTGGEGGHYAKSVNLTLTPGAVINMQIGAGGATPGAAGTATWLGGTSLATSLVGAVGGAGGTGTVANATTATTNDVGNSVVRAGGLGAGFGPDSSGGAGGGGAAGPGGVGGAGGAPGSTPNGAGGGGAGNTGGAGGPGQVGPGGVLGGVGGTAGDGTAGGAAGTATSNPGAGTNGSGGGGPNAGFGTASGAAGGAGNESTWGGTIGPGGGGGAGGHLGNGGAGGLYGGGGGGAGYQPTAGPVPGQGAPGVLVVTYTPLGGSGGGGGGTAFTCPFSATASVDGCASAPAGGTAAYYHPGGFAPGGYVNTTAGTSSNYMNTNCGPAGTAPCLSQRNKPGFDYAIANYTGVAFLKDPALIATTQPKAGCTYGTNGQTEPGGHAVGLVTCGGASWDGTFSHYNMGTWSGAGTPHGCTALLLQATGFVGSAVTLDDNNFINDTGLCVRLPSTSNGSLFAWGNDSPDVFSVPITISNTYMDGNYPVWNSQKGGAGCTTTYCNPSNAMRFVSSVGITLKYSAITRFNCYMWVGAQNGWKMVNSVVDGWFSRNPCGHGEFWVGNGGFNSIFTVNQFDWLDNVFLGRWDQDGDGTAPIEGTVNWAVAFPNGANFKNNVIIDPSIGQASYNATLSGCAGATFNGTTCSGSGNTFWATSVTGGTIGPGETTGSQGGCTKVDSLLANLGSPPAGAVSRWSIEETFQTWPAVNDSFTCTNAVMSNQVANNGFLSFSDAVNIGPTSFIGNYFDLASTNGKGIFNVYGFRGGAQINVSGSATGTSLLASVNQTLSTGQLIYAADVPGCSTSVLSCLTVSSGGTLSSFTMSGSANIGPETLEALINEVSFTGSISGTTLTTSASTTLTAGDYVYGVGITGCSSNPTSCPKISTTTTGTNFTLSSSGGSVSSEAMNTLRNTVNFNGTINNASVGAIASGTKLLPSTTLYATEFVVGASVPGCSSGVPACPTIASSATGTSFTITPSVGTGPFAVTSVNQQEYCTVPVTFSGNTDMTAGANWPGGAATINAVLNPAPGALNSSSNNISGC